MEVALARAYNRFMAEVWAKSGGRIRWVVVPALRDIDASIAELRFGKARTFKRGRCRDSFESNFCN